MSDQVKTPTKRRKKCSDCEELFPPDEIIDGLCEDCDGHYTYCELCEERQHEDSVCRHVFACEETSWEWYGAGSGGTAWKHHKDSFLIMLDRTGLAELLRVTIKTDKLDTHYHGSMLGPSSYCCRLKSPDTEYTYDYGHRFTDGLTSGLEEEMTIGVGWLDSLQYGDSPLRAKARALTLTWIDEWLADPLRRVAAGIGIPAATCLEWEHGYPDYPDKIIRGMAIGYARAAKEAMYKKERQS